MQPSLRHLRISDLDLFVTAAHVKNLGKAAKIHNLSQSAASAVIQRVEMGFNLSLCHHEKRQFRLTQEGAALVPKIEAWLKQFHETLTSNLPRPIRLATTHALGTLLIPALLPIDTIDLHLARPDQAYARICNDDADIAFVPANTFWKGVRSVEIGTGFFQLYSTVANAPLAPVLLPEDQLEVLTLLRGWKDLYNTPLNIKARIPSWSLIAAICTTSKEIGFLPDFLAKNTSLQAVPWQPPPPDYTILALHRQTGGSLYDRLLALIDASSRLFRKEIDSV